MFTKEYGVRWVEVKPGGLKLSWQKLARFRYWTEHGVDIFVVRSFEEFDSVMSEPSNWTSVTRPTQIAKAIKNYETMGLPDPDPVDMWEHQISTKLKHILVARGWMFEKTHGNVHQVGWPDYYAHHPEFGYRWVEMKTPKGKLRPTQTGRFNQWTKAGCKIWVLDSTEFGALFREPNWKKRPRRKWGIKL